VAVGSASVRSSSSGDQQGKIGWGFGKANEVADAIKKATEASRKDMVKIVLNNNTIPHEVIGEHGGGYASC
jgi:small subunit ribosomal protein S5